MLKVTILVASREGFGSDALKKILFVWYLGVLYLDSDYLAIYICKLLKQCKEYQCTLNTKLPSDMVRKLFGIPGMHLQNAKKVTQWEIPPYSFDCHP